MAGFVSCWRTFRCSAAVRTVFVALVVVALLVGSSGARPVEIAEAQASAVQPAVEDVSQLLDPSGVFSALMKLARKRRAAKAKPDDGVATARPVVRVRSYYETAGGWYGGYGK